MLYLISSTPFKVKYFQTKIPAAILDLIQCTQETKCLSGFIFLLSNIASTEPSDLQKTCFKKIYLKIHIKIKILILF